MKKAFVCSLVLLLSPPFLLRSQISNNTSLVGTVGDRTGSVVSGAKVMGVERSTKVQYSAVTSAAGYYSITFIESGTYDITGEQPGFSKVTTSGVPGPTDIAVRTDFTLSVGSAADTVTVSAGTPPISTDDASLGETLAPSR